MPQPLLLAARLKHRITIEEPQRTSDNAGGYSIVWNMVDTVWAEVVPLCHALGHA